MQEQLLGHLLGALEEPEQQEVAARLQQDPGLRREQSRIRRRLEPLEGLRRDFALPAGLAERTCCLVASYAAARPAGSRRRAMSPETSPPSWIGGFRWLDAVVAAGVFAVAMWLIIAAIQSSRFNARLIACQENLRGIGTALAGFSERHDGYFPRIPTRGRLAFAGIYASKLLGDGFLEESRQLICPDSPLADQSGLRVLPLGELEEASDEEVKQLLPGLARIYGIHLGHVEGGVYRDTRNLGRTYFAVAADPPSVDLPGHQSLHHGGRGQNVLFEAGNVRFLTSSKPYPQADDIYVNDLGVMTAGAHRDDSVVGFGSATPLLNVNYSH